MTNKLLGCVCAVALVSACGEDTPTAPSITGSIVFGEVMPPSGSPITVRLGTLGGIFIDRGSGQLSIPLVIRNAPDVDWAKLNVYLLTGNTIDGYCGQNLPDSPVWRPWIGRRRHVQFTVTGFQISRVPCDVTGVRAMLHVRQGGLLIPPTATETLAEGILPVQFHLGP